MASNQASIAIIGGGPSGLCLGVLLHKQGIPFTIYELREKFTEEMLSMPCGMLDLHPQSGLAAVRACGVWDKFVPLTAECGQDMIIMNKDGDVLHTDHGEGSDRPEISRNVLGDLFLSEVPAESVMWKHKLVSATRKQNGKIELDFGSNGIKEHDYVVGADGAWSKVRPLLTDVKPHYGGVSYSCLHILQASTKYPDISTMIGPGSCLTLGKNNGVFTHRSVNDSVTVHLCVTDEDEHAINNKTSNLTCAQMKDFLFTDPKTFGKWADKIRHMLTTGCDEEEAFSGPTMPPLKPMYMLPLGHKWEAQPGAALIGDAAHLMMPWAGEGVNLALLDSMDLAVAITKAWGQSSEAVTFQEKLLPEVAEFNKKMFERSHESAEETWANCGIMFSEDGAKSMADWMDKMLSGAGAEEHVAA